MSSTIIDENTEIVDEYSNVDRDEELDPDNNEDDMIDYDETAAEESY